MKYEEYRLAHYYSPPFYFSKAGIKKVIKEQSRNIKKYKSTKKKSNFPSCISLELQG